MSDINPYDLFKFIQEDVTNEKLFEATDTAYKSVDEKSKGNQNAWKVSAGSLSDVYYVETAEEAKAEFEDEHGRKSTNCKDVTEGKLPANLNNIEDPEKEIWMLAEEKKKKAAAAKKKAHPDSADNPDIKTDNSGVTEEPEITKFQKQMNKETPNVDKLSDFETSAGISKTKEVKNKTVRVNTLQKEGKLPKNLNNIENPEQDIWDLAEYDSNQNNGEIIADGISDENVARDLAHKNNGVAVQSPDSQLWSVKTRAQENSSGSQGVVPGSAAREAVEPADECKDCGCGNKDCKCAPGKCTCKKVKEEVEIVDEEKTTSDVAGQPDEGKTSHAQSDVSKSAARGKATDKNTPDSQSTSVEDQVGQSISNAQKIVKQSAARTAATDKQTASQATNDLSSDQSAAGKSAAQSDVNKSAARTQATDGAGKPAPMVGGSKKVKEEVEKTDEAIDISVTSDEGDVNISSDGVSTTVTTSNSAAELPMDALAVDPMVGAPVDDLGPELDPMLDDELFLEDEDQPEFSDEEALEMAERLMVAEHLTKKMDEGCGMSAKQKKFIEDMKDKKFSKKNKKKVDDKKKEIK